MGAVLQCVDVFLQCMGVATLSECCVWVWGCTIGGVCVPCVFSHARWNYHWWFKFLLICLLSVVGYWLPLLVVWQCSNAVFQCMVVVLGPLQTYTTAKQHSMKQQIDTNFVEFTLCASSKPGPKALLGCGAAAVDVCGKDRTSPVLCSMWPCCSQSQLGHQPVWTSDKTADRVELFDSKMARQIDLYYKPEIVKNITSVHNSI